MKVYFDQIYEHLGYLFYAIASEKRKLNSDNIVRLQQIIDQQWKLSTNNDIMLYSHLFDYLKSGLRNAIDNALQPGEAFERFKSYFELHQLPFIKELRVQIMVTAKSIMAEFSGADVQDDFIVRLQNMFELKPPENVSKQVIQK